MSYAASAQEWFQSDLETLRKRYSELTEAQEAYLIKKVSVCAALTFIMLLVLPGRTVSHAFANDMMVFLDGGSRVLDGQLPNRDFHTPLGLLSYLLPALGLWIGGSLGSMMPIATAAFALLFLPLILHICLTRLPLRYAVVFTIWCLTLVITPASIGEVVPSFGMFYNRWGYALLAILFLLPLPHLRLRGFLSDATVVSAVLILTFYLKISYFGVALGFVILLLCLPETRKFAGRGIAGATAGLGLVHLFWLGTGAYLNDIAAAGAASGAIRGSIAILIREAIDNAAMLFPFLLVLGLAAVGGAAPRKLALAVAIAAAGVLLANQNTQALGMLTTIPAAILAVCCLGPTKGQEKHSAQLTGFLLVLTMAIPPAFSNALSIVSHWSDATFGPKSALPLTELDGFSALASFPTSVEQTQFESTRLVYRRGTANLGELNAIRGELPGSEYLGTVADGVQLLQQNPRLSGRIFTVDFTNPMNALTGRSAPQGVYSWYHHGRTFDQTTFEPAARTFRDVDVVLIPKAPVDLASHSLLISLYGEYIDRHYKLAAKSDYWLAYARSTHEAAWTAGPDSTIAHLESARAPSPRSGVTEK